MEAINPSELATTCCLTTS